VNAGFPTADHSIPQLIANAIPHDSVAPPRMLDHIERTNPDVWRRRSPPPEIPPPAESTDDHIWTVRERNQILRGLLRLGFGRWTAFQKVIGLYLPCSQIARGAIAMVKLLLTMVKGNDQYLGCLHSILDEAPEEAAFGDGTVFRAERFHILLTKFAMIWIKEFDLMSRFQFSMELVTADEQPIPPIRLGGLAFTDTWKEEHDSALCYASWRYGLGTYDHITEACDSHQIQLLLPMLTIEESRLSDRARKVCKFVASIPMSPDKVIETLSSRDIEEWPQEDQMKIIEHLLQFGIDLDRDDDPDYATLGIRCGLRERTDIEIQEFVEMLVSECRKFGGDGQLPAGVASHLVERIETMATLRSLLRKPADELRKLFHDIRWRGVPKSWQPDHELYFFRELHRRGFGCADEVLQDRKLSSLFEAEPPSLLTQPEELIHRIRKIHARVHRPSLKARRAAPIKAKREAPVLQRRSIAIPGWSDIWNDGNVHYPVQIGGTSALLHIGRIVTDRPGFHGPRYIYPAGYKSSREYYSVKRPSQRVFWVSEIIDDGGPRPLFRVYEQDHPNVCFEGAAASAPWTSILKAVSASRREKKANTISGPLAYLLDSPIVARLIQAQPGARDCENYQWRTFADDE
jgi:chromodomain-helicase-DNA-binding protein 7